MQQIRVEDLGIGNFKARKSLPVATVRRDYKALQIAATLNKEIDRFM